MMTLNLRMTQFLFLLLIALVLVLVLTPQTADANIGSLFSNATSSYNTGAIRNYNNHNTTGVGFLQDLGGGLDGSMASVTVHVVANGADNRIVLFIRECDDAAYTLNCQTAFQEYWTILGNSQPYTYSLGNGSFQEVYGNQYANADSFEFLPTKYYYALFASNTQTGSTRTQKTSTVNTYPGGACIRNCGVSVDVAFEFEGSVSDHSVNTDITSTTTWAGDIPFVISGEVEVQSGATLIIEPGVVVKFDTSTSSRLIVNGTLEAEGVFETAEIHMTSLEDDYWGDTNGNGSSTDPAAGDWGGIVVNSGGEAVLSNINIRYAGATSSYSSQIYNNGGTITMDGGSVVYGTSYGIKNNSGSITVENSELAYQDYGFYMNGGSATISAANVIHHNGLYGIYNNTGSSIDAEDNYWGHISGPYHSSTNPFGVGNEVSDSVDYSPFDDDLHYLTGTSSVILGEIRWDGATQYLSEWYASIDIWNALGGVLIATDTPLTAENLTVSDVDDDDLAWTGQYSPQTWPTTDKLRFNEYYLKFGNSSSTQMTITHELGHALGLDHSYRGNIMYFQQTEQTTLGDQDVDDYNFIY